MYLYGAGGHAKVIIDILELQNIKIDGLFDDNPDIKSLSGYQVVPYHGAISSSEEVIISIGNNRIRKKIAGQPQHDLLQGSGP